LCLATINLSGDAQSLFMDHDFDNISDCRAAESMSESRSNFLAVGVVAKKNRSRR
jgi:hypothetical protein